MTTQDYYSINTSTEGWQCWCWDSAKGRTQFQVEGALNSYAKFFEELSLAYRYKLEHSNTAVRFVPPKP